MAVKKSERSRLISRIDEAFSRFIRLRDRIDDHHCVCCTCGKAQKWRDMDCGHFVSRRKLSVRFDPMNAYSQCRSCNRFQQGEQYAMGKHIDRTHGEGTADEVRRRGEKYYSPNINELKELKKYWQGKAKEADD